MSIMRALSRGYDRLTGVLAYDCNGRRLRRGDVVEPVAWIAEQAVCPEARCQLTVQRSGVLGDVHLFPRLPSVELVLTNPDGELIGARAACHLRKVPPGARAASWESVERLTGWTPSTTEIKRREDEEVAS